MRLDVGSVLLLLLSGFVALVTAPVQHGGELPSDDAVKRTTYFLQGNPGACPSQCQIEDSVMVCHHADGLNYVQLAKCVDALCPLSNLHQMTMGDTWQKQKDPSLMGPHLSLELRSLKEMCSCSLLDYVRLTAEAKVITITPTPCGRVLLTFCRSMLSERSQQIQHIGLAAGLLMEQNEPGWRQATKRHLSFLWNKVNSLYPTSARTRYRALIIKTVKSVFWEKGKLAPGTTDRILPFMVYKNGHLGPLYGNGRLGWLPVQDFMAAVDSASGTRWISVEQYKDVKKKMEDEMEKDNKITSDSENKKEEEKTKNRPQKQGKGTEVSEKTAQETTEKDTPSGSKEVSVKKVVEQKESNVVPATEPPSTTEDKTAQKITYDHSDSEAIYKKKSLPNLKRLILVLTIIGLIIGICIAGIIIQLRGKDFSASKFSFLRSLSRFSRKTTQDEAKKSASVEDHDASMKDKYKPDEITRRLSQPYSHWSSSDFQLAREMDEEKRKSREGPSHGQTAETVAAPGDSTKSTEDKNGKPAEKDAEIIANGRRSSGQEKEKVTPKNNECIMETCRVNPRKEQETAAPQTSGTGATNGARKGSGATGRKTSLQGNKWAFLEDDREIHIPEVCTCDIEARIPDNLINQYIEMDVDRMFLGERKPNEMKKPEQKSDNMQPAETKQSEFFQLKDGKASSDYRQKRAGSASSTGRNSFPSAFSISDPLLWQTHPTKQEETSGVPTSGVDDSVPKLLERLEKTGTDPSDVKIQGHRRTVGFQESDTPSIREPRSGPFVMARRPTGRPKHFSFTMADTTDNCARLKSQLGVKQTIPKDKQAEYDKVTKDKPVLSESHTEPSSSGGDSWTQANVFDIVDEIQREERKPGITEEDSKRGVRFAKIPEKDDGRDVFQRSFENILDADHKKQKADEDKAKKEDKTETKATSEVKDQSEIKGKSESKEKIEVKDKPEVKPEVTDKAEVKPEVTDKAGVKSEVKDEPETKEETKDKPEVKAEDKSKPEIKSKSESKEKLEVKDQGKDEKASKSEAGEVKPPTEEGAEETKDPDKPKAAEEAIDRAGGGEMGEGDKIPGTEIEPERKGSKKRSSGKKTSSGKKKSSSEKRKKSDEGAGASAGESAVESEGGSKKEKKKKKRKKSGAGEGGGEKPEGDATGGETEAGSEGGESGSKKKRKKKKKGGEGEGEGGKTEGDAGSERESKKKKKKKEGGSEKKGGGSKTKKRKEAGAKKGHKKKPGRKKTEHETARSPDRSNRSNSASSRNNSSSSRQPTPNPSVGFQSRRGISPDEFTRHWYSEFSNWPSGLYHRSPYYQRPSRSAVRRLSFNKRHGRAGDPGTTFEQGSSSEGSDSSSSHSDIIRMDRLESPGGFVPTRPIRKTKIKRHAHGSGEARSYSTTGRRRSPVAEHSKLFKRDKRGRENVKRQGFQEDSGQSRLLEALYGGNVRGENFKELIEANAQSIKLNEEDLVEFCSGLHGDGDVRETETESSRNETSRIKVKSPQAPKRKEESYHLSRHAERKTSPKPRVYLFAGDRSDLILPSTKESWKQWFEVDAEKRDKDKGTGVIQICLGLHGDNSASESDETTDFDNHNGSLKKQNPSFDRRYRTPSPKRQTTGSIIKKPSPLLRSENKTYGIRSSSDTAKVDICSRKSVAGISDNEDKVEKKIIRSPRSEERSSLKYQCSPRTSSAGSPVPKPRSRSKQELQASPNRQSRVGCQRPHQAPTTSTREVHFSVDDSDEELIFKRSILALPPESKMALPSNSEIDRCVQNLERMSPNVFSRLSSHFHKLEQEKKTRNKLPVEDINASRRDVTPQTSKHTYTDQSHMSDPQSDTTGQTSEFVFDSEMPTHISETTQSEVPDPHTPCTIRSPQWISPSNQISCSVTSSNDPSLTQDVTPTASSSTSSSSMQDVCLTAYSGASGSEISQAVSNRKPARYSQKKDATSSESQPSFHSTGAAPVRRTRSKSSVSGVGYNTGESHFQH